MNTNSLVTLDAVHDFFTLDKPLKPVARLETLTGGFGIDNRDQYPPPQPLRPRVKGGTDYASQYIEKERNEECEPQRRQTVDLPGGSTVSLSEFGEFDKVEELSPAFGDIPSTQDLDAERAQELYSTYYSEREKVKYNPDLPITSFREKILSRIDANQVVVIQGSTGCGKTTQVPQYILDHHAASGKYCNVIVTQPRKIAAISVARRVCQERNWGMGTIVGYQVAMDNKISPDTRLSFVTTGVLLQKFVNSRRMDMYTHVILDEVHERDQDTDFALLVVKKLLRTNSKHVKVILMSATIDSLLFARYFTIPGLGKSAPVVEIEGKAKEVSEHYLLELAGIGIPLPELDPVVPSAPEESYDLVVKLVLYFDKIEKSEQNVTADVEFAPYRGAILIFLPGFEEIMKMSSKLEELIVKRKLIILPLHSSITMEEQTRVFQTPPTGYRKVIISTNIAESSITVPDIKYVVDFCLTKSLVSDPETNYTCLQLEWASKANCTQRKGRAGRVDTGRVYRMVPYKFYEQLNEYSVPEMKRCPLHQTVLFTKKLNFGEPQALLALAVDPPALTDIEKSILTLKEVAALSVTAGGVLTPFDGDLTFIGRVMSALPLDVYISKLVILGYVFNCLEDCLIIAASLSLKSFLSRPFRKMLDAYKCRLAWAEGTFSDCFAYLNAYKVWKNLELQGRFRNPNQEIAWGQSSFVQIKRIKEVDMLVRELEKRLEAMNIRINYNREKIDEDVETQILKIVIAGAFYPNYYVQDTVVEQEVLREVNNNDPLCTVVLTGLPSNQGLLYAHPIKEMLWGCAQHMNIDFEERKAYVTFNDSSLKEATRVSQSVYLAVKMRQLRVPLDLHLFNSKDAERKMIQLRAMKSSADGRKLHTNRMTFQAMPSSIKQVPLPKINTLTISIFISHIIDCGHFWARYMDQTYQTRLGMLGEMINSNKGRNMLPLSQPLKLGMLLLAPYKENPMRPESCHYYRARVDEINERDGKVTVFFVDYGNTMEKIPIKDLRQIDKEAAPDVLITPAMAFECQLCEVKPAATLSSTTGAWSKAATRFFCNKVNGQVLTAKVYSVVQNVVRLELRSPVETEHESINVQLIRFGFAECAEETYVSKQNYELRLKTDAQFASGRSYDCEDNVLCYSVDENLDLQGLIKTTQKVRLKGPFSPLEVTYQGMTKVDSYRSVNIDRDSVNSVSLTSDPRDTEGHMLIGCQVGLSPHNNSITVRSTTLMPKVRGLPALLCLLFAPFAELRSDPKRTRYTGVLCGLGYDAATSEALYPEHDIELIFDTKIETSDIRSVNAIRMGINLILDHDGEQAGISIDNLRTIQTKLRFQVLDFLRKSRDTCEPLPFGYKYQWQQIPPESILRPPDLAQGNSPHVLPLHYAINLIADTSLQNEMKKHLQELYAKANDRLYGRINVKCKLCSETLYTQRDLKFHLRTPQHTAKEDDLVQ